MPRRQRGATLIMVVFLVFVIGVAGAIAVQYAYMARIEQRQALVEANARQVLASGLAWAQLNQDQLPASSQSRALPVEQLVDSVAEAQLHVTRCDGADEDCITIETRVSVGRIAANRSVQRAISPTADAASTSPD